MKLGLAILLLALSLAAALPPQNEKIQVVLVGQIRKIDVKGRVITVRERVFPERGVRRGPPPPPMLGPDFPPDPPRRGRGRAEVETKVTYSSQTTIKSADKQIDLTQLKVGDSVRITGRTANKEILATEIERLTKK